MSGTEIEARLRRLADRGVVVVDPRQTYIDGEVRIDRICAGVVLHPCTRLQGKRTFLGPGAEVGCEGPATLVDSVLGEGAKIMSGTLHGAVLLRGAQAGAGAHFREGTLLEEQASTAHSVGLKHTILLSFATLGSVINFCDALVAGGTSRSDHSEVGSGFIHFNFTPWGERGDKATPSLVGDVVRGVFLREPRIFLGGVAGMVGPRQVGFGSVTAAGQVLRKDVPDRHIVLQHATPFSLDHIPGKIDKVDRAKKNVAYVAQLVALRAWYRHVRLGRIPDGEEHAHRRIVIQEALDTLRLCISERQKRLASFLEERGFPAPSLDLSPEESCPLPVDSDAAYVHHIDWVRALPDAAVAAGVHWLQSVVDRVVAQVQAHLR